MVTSSRTIHSSQKAFGRPCPAHRDQTTFNELLSHVSAYVSMALMVKSSSSRHDKPLASASGAIVAAIGWGQTSLYSRGKKICDKVGYMKGMSATMMRQPHKPFYTPPPWGCRSRPKDGYQCINDDDLRINDGCQYLKDDDHRINDGCPRWKVDGKRINDDSPRLKDDDQWFNDGCLCIKDDDQLFNDGSPLRKVDGKRINDGYPCRKDDDQRFNDGSPRLKDDDQPIHDGCLCIKDSHQRINDGCLFRKDDGKWIHYDVEQRENDDLRGEVRDVNGSGSRAKQPNKAFVRR